MLAIPSAAEAQGGKETILYGSAKGWDVYIDSSVGYGCFAATAYDGDAFLRFGFWLKDGATTAYFSIGDADWASIEEGKDYPLTFQIDDLSPWTTTARAMKLGDVPTLTTEVGRDSLDFFDQFARRHSLRATYEGQQIAALRLTGSSAALGKLLECQKSVNEIMAGRNNSPADPFKAPAPRQTKDPFKL